MTFLGSKPRARGVLESRLQSFATKKIGNTKQHNNIKDSSNKEYSNKADYCASDATFFAAIGIGHKHNHG
jgi:hypothetical protein